ncbi:hypothetical protein APHAL10511_005794 [Amanita phalloides]|nr:hypothetical protein APHAL10511_005794 [Amanita phalloides]
MIMLDLSRSSTILLLLSYFSAASASVFPPRLPRSLGVPIPSTDLSSLIKYHLSHIPYDFTEGQYKAGQPTSKQRDAWLDVILSLLNVKDKLACSSVTVPDVLKGLYTVTEVDSGKFCALVEVVAGDQEKFSKGWGIFVVPTAPHGTSPKLHLSAPHPVFDLNVAEETTYVFEHTGAKSLYVPGRSSQAFKEKTDCIPSTAKTTYYKTDATHDDREMMFETHLAIKVWQDDQGGGCRLDSEGRASCAYIEFFGKGKTTCPKEDIFLSAGLGREPDSLAWYKDHAHAHIPMYLLSSSIQKHFPSATVTTPAAPGSTCDLTGAKNIIARLINNISEVEVCRAPATAKTATGFFVQIEQDLNHRKKENWKTWVSVFSEAFGH